MEVNEANLAVDEIAQIGPGGTFITSERTLERMYETALMPDIADRQPRETWADYVGAEVPLRRITTCLQDFDVVL